MPHSIEGVSEESRAKVRQYIKRTWTTLTRSHGHLIQALEDKKIDHKPNEPW
jgi:alpha,alpha-trehalase